jgi:ubiquinone/menaquinone biosynthesis C-methylase UbiE
MGLKKQVNKDAYSFRKYCYPERWSSYYEQLKSVVGLDIKEILEIGCGDGVFREYIKNNTPIKYSSLDIATDLNPDYVGSVTEMPFEDMKFDCVCAFEVLEHISFEQFGDALMELKRVSKKYVVLSIPHFGPMIKFELKIPFFSGIRVSFKVPFPKKHNFNGQHYWEIGKRSYSQKRILTLCEKHFNIIKHYVPFDAPYHHFFILEK